VKARRSGGMGIREEYTGLVRWRFCPKICVLRPIFALSGVKQ